MLGIGDMLTHQIGDFLRRLRAGEIDAASADLFEDLPAADFIGDVRSPCPILFQERSVGSKTELGLAKSLQFQLALPRNGSQTLFSADLFPIFRRCFLISTYHDRISGVTAVKSIRIWPSADRKGIVVAMSSGYKLDRMPDGWAVKKLERRKTVLSESFLRARGWRFDVLRLFNGRS